MKRKIGWQKYENVIEDQLSSPILQELLAITNPPMEMVNTEEFTYEELESLQKELVYDTQSQSQSVALTDDFISQVNMLAQFDCWVGHTNFNITKTIKDTLNAAEGVEILKVNSRYRFFIGVGKMFDFKDVRTNIEEKLL
jgi:hypothetical protein|tara:strand:- start:189 stop:608 length:420 start_codon:yes stop_codon:yes gene_type:complete